VEVYFQRNTPQDLNSDVECYSNIFYVNADMANRKLNVPNIATGDRFADIEGKFVPIRDYEGPQGKKKISSTPSLTSALDGGG
jgi:hypothetical protein